MKSDQKKMECHGSIPPWLLVVWCGLLNACSPGGELPTDIKTIEIPSADLRSMAIESNGRYLYVADYSLSRIHRINLAVPQYDYQTSITVDGRPVALSLSKDEQTLFVAIERDGAGQLAAVSTSDGSSFETIKLDGTPANLTRAQSDVLYVDIKSASSSIPAYKFGFNPQLQSSSLITGDDLVGASHNGQWLVTASPDFSDTPRVTLYDIGQSPPVAHLLGELFGSRLTKQGKVAFSPDDRELYVFSDGTTSQGDNFPACQLSGDLSQCKLLRRFDVPFLPNAFAVSSITGRALIAHGTDKNQWRPMQHDLSIPDLHVYDPATSAELGSIALPAHVHSDGIRVGNNGTVYLLLGEQTASTIAIVTP